MLRVAPFALAAALTGTFTQPAPEPPQLASLGKCVLQSGAAVEDCRIGYRTYGTLNAERSNAVLVPTAFNGTSRDIDESIGPEQMLDPSEHFIISVDALGNGVSSSPSNSISQPGAKFPVFTIRDMVETQRRLVTETLRIPGLRAVVGTSMGGMQAIEWIVAHPDLVERAVSILGSPQLSSYDLLVWETMLRGIEASQGCEACDPVGVFTPLAFLVLNTPQRFVARTPREKFGEFLRSRKEAFRKSYEPEDLKAQIRALMAHDVAARFGGSLVRAAERIAPGRLLIVVATQDHIVRPEPAISFAKLTGADLLELTGDCGHGADRCEAAAVALRVRSFLSRH